MVRGFVIRESKSFGIAAIVRISSDTVLGNWAVVSYKDDTGLGRMAEDARRVLGIGHQVVIPSRRIPGKSLGTGDFLLGQNHSEMELKEFLSSLDGILVFEKPDWTPSLLPMAKELQLAVAVVPMWEWFRVDDPLWKWCDLFICPNQKCYQVVTGSGHRNAVVLPWVMDLERLPTRNVEGPARVFIHNAGLVDHDDRKGTRDTVRAFEKASDRNAKLRVRVQTPVELGTRDERVEVAVGNLPDAAALWEAGDVAIQPSKMEGIGLMVLEPVCAGIPVITLNAAPMNEYAAELLVEPRWFRRNAFASQWIPHARLHLPSRRHLTDLIEATTRMDLGGISQRQRQWAEETFDREKLRREWTRALHGITSDRAVICA